MKDFKCLSCGLIFRATEGLIKDFWCPYCGYENVYMEKEAKKIKEAMLFSHASFPDAIGYYHYYWGQVAYAEKVKLITIEEKQILLKLRNELFGRGGY